MPPSDDETDQGPEAVFVYQWQDAPRISHDFPTADDPARLTWVHADRRRRATHDWIHSLTRIPAAARQALLEEDTRPRVLACEGGLLVILRAVELTPGDQPDDLISLRMWIDADCLISLRSRALKAPARLRERIDQGLPISDSGHLLTGLCQHLTEDLGDLVEDLREQIGDLEERSFDEHLIDQRQILANQRRRIVALRRHMAPQASALTRLQGLALVDHQLLREWENRTQRILEELQQLAERGQLLHGDISAAMQE